MSSVEAEARIARKADLAFGSLLTDAREGFLMARRRRRWPHAPARVDGPAQWGASIPEDAPIWAPMRKGTRCLKADELGKEEQK